MGFVERFKRAQSAFHYLAAVRALRSIGHGAAGRDDLLPHVHACLELDPWFTHEDSGHAEYLLDKVAAAR